MPAPSTRDISISRAKPATRLTIVSPPMVNVDLWRFIARPDGCGSGFPRGLLFAAARAACLAPFALLRCLELRKIRAGEIDRVEHQRRGAGIWHGLGGGL